MKTTLPSKNPELDLSSCVRARICSHIDGIAVGTTVSTLRQRGIFDRLARSKGPLSISGLAKECGIKIGYFHLDMRLLELQGWVRREGNLAEEESVVFTANGFQWFEFLSLYDAMPAIVGASLALPACLDGRQTWEFSGNIEAGDVVTQIPASLQDRVRLQTAGPVVGAIMCEFDRRRVWTEAFRPDGVADMAAFPPQWKPAFEILARQGWLEIGEKNLRLTEAGKFARRFSTFYWIPVSYLPMFAKVPEMLTDATAKPAGISPRAGVKEWHVDRALDISASGLVFSYFCKQPFFEIILPLFNDSNLARQPSAIVDTGSGDGTLLIELYRAIASQTIRGRYLEEQPLIMVGAEYTEVARGVTGMRLREAGVPHITVFGDIGDPDGLARNIQAQGIDSHDVLHVSKSVIHNRTYVTPAAGPELTSWTPISTAVFTGAEGERIPTRMMELNLIEHFRKWRSWIGRHGMVVIEAHAADAVEAARTAGFNFMTALESCHGYSHQYLVEPEVHRRCAEAGGLKSRDSRKVSGPLTTRPIFSLDHFVVAGRK